VLVGSEGPDGEKLASRMQRKSLGGGERGRKVWTNGARVSWSVRDKDLR